MEAGDYIDGAACAGITSCLLTTGRSTGAAAVLATGDIRGLNGPGTWARSEANDVGTSNNAVGKPICFAVTLCYALAGHWGEMDDPVLRSDLLYSTSPFVPAERARRRARRRGASAKRSSRGIARPQRRCFLEVHAPASHKTWLVPVRLAWGEPVPRRHGAIAEVKNRPTTAGGGNSRGPSSGSSTDTRPSACRGSLRPVPADARCTPGDGDQLDLKAGVERSGGARQLAGPACSIF